LWRTAFAMLQLPVWAQDTNGEVTQTGHHARAVAGADPRSVLSVGDVADVVCGASIPHSPRVNLVPRPFCRPAGCESFSDYVPGEGAHLRRCFDLVLSGFPPYRARREGRAKLTAAGDPELRKDVVQVCADRPVGQIQLVSDVSV
jgi:hypothetical protein